MPIYEYRCEACGKKSEFLTFRISDEVDPVCKHCGSEKMVRLISRVRVIMSEETRLESLADPSKFGDLDENDPKSMAKFLKKMGREFGDELGEELGGDIDEIVEADMEEEDRSKESGESADDTGLDSSPE
ncbi:MAG: zinc ribbon domain-containing protein [Deltaproteobacteria bacterium]|nr:MAG: zinc ribbon domain-containing protein [Deltaproteobacteria bacterium]